jgi:hypothetical protein
MKKFIFFVLMSAFTISGFAQSKTTTESSAKSSETYTFNSTFESDKTDAVLNYLKNEIGENNIKTKVK